MTKQTTQTRRTKATKTTVTASKKSATSATTATAQPPKTSVKTSVKTAVKNTRKEKTPTPPAPEPVEEVVEEVPSEQEDGSSTTTTRKTRRVVTHESLVEEGDALVKMIEDEIAAIRESETKTKGVKFLRSLNKKVKTYKTNVVRVTKQRPRTKRNNTTNSGFLKPVRISQEMCDFTGWDPVELKSRVDVTKYICKYIKDNDLQNPEDRREIRADEKLRELLSYNPETDGALKYYDVQRCLKPHFLPVEEKTA